MSSMRIGELSTVDARGMICRERVRDQEAQRGLDDEDLRVGAEENV